MVNFENLLHSLKQSIEAALLHEEGLTFKIGLLEKSGPELSPRQSSKLRDYYYQLKKNQAEILGGAEPRLTRGQETNYRCLYVYSVHYCRERRHEVVFGAGDRYSDRQDTRPPAGCLNCGLSVTWGLLANHAVTDRRYPIGLLRDGVLVRS